MEKSKSTREQLERAECVFSSYFRISDLFSFRFFSPKSKFDFRILVCPFSFIAFDKNSVIFLLRISSSSSSSSSSFSSLFDGVCVRVFVFGSLQDLLLPFLSFDSDLYVFCPRGR